MYLSLQFIATTVKNLLLIDLGLILALPTIVIAAMSGIPNEHNRNEFLSITPEEASWIGKTSNTYHSFEDETNLFFHLPFNLKKKSENYIYWLYINIDLYNWEKSAHFKKMSIVVDCRKHWIFVPTIGIIAVCLLNRYKNEL